MGPQGDTGDFHCCGGGEDHRGWTFPHQLQAQSQDPLYPHEVARLELAAGSDRSKKGSVSLVSSPLCLLRGLEGLKGSDFCLMNFSILVYLALRRAKVRRLARFSLVSGTFVFYLSRALWPQGTMSFSINI